MIPINPEPIEALRARLPAALVDTYSVEFCRRFPNEGPGKKPEHVFDFDTGERVVRAIVSIDVPSKGGPVLHVSVSSSDGHVPSLTQAFWVYAQLRGPGVSKLRGGLATCRCTHLFFDPPAGTGGGR